MGGGEVCSLKALQEALRLYNTIEVRAGVSHVKVAKSDGSISVFVQISEAPEPFLPGACLPGPGLTLSRSKSCVVVRGRKGTEPYPGSEH